MTLKSVHGDLFKNDVGAAALAHGVNCAGVMGKGIAVQFRRTFPDMFVAYSLVCSAGQLKPGDLFVWSSSTPVVFNLATQLRPIANSATYPAIETSLMKTRLALDELGLTSIAVPMIGCGIGGLQWSEVRRIIATIFQDWSGTVFAYEG